MIEDMLMGGSLAALSGALLAVSIIVLIALYVYMALAWSTIARKLKYENDWLAWIPLACFALMPILAEKDWPWVFILLIPVVNIVFMIMWMWRIYERRNMHGALSLITIGNYIPFISWIAGIANLVLIGVAAWKD